MRQVAAYAAGCFSLSDALKAIVGVRVGDWKNTDRMTPSNSYAGLIYDLSKTHALYASYTGIVKPQNNRDRNGRYLAPLQGDSYEVGAKSEYFGGRLDAALALFRIEQDNLAVADPGQVVPGSVLLANAMARYDIDRAWSAQLNVRNLFDRKYYANIVYQTQLIYGDPRDVELTLSRKF